MFFVPVRLKIRICATHLYQISHKNLSVIYICFVSLLPLVGITDLLYLTSSAAMICDWAPVCLVHAARSLGGFFSRFHFQYFTSYFSFLYYTFPPFFLHFIAFPLLLIVPSPSASPGLLFLTLLLLSYCRRFNLPPSLNRLSHRHLSAAHDSQDGCEVTGIMEICGTCPDKLLN